MPKTQKVSTPDGWTIEGIRTRADQLTKARGRMDSAWRDAGASPEDATFRTQLGSSNEQYAYLYGPIIAAIAGIQAGDSGGVEVLVRFLEADIYCFHSGYMKSETIRALIRVDLSTSASDRLRKVVLAVIQAYDRQEFRSYVRLARRLDSAGFRLQLRAVVDSPPTSTARRAGWVLAGLEAKS